MRALNDARSHESSDYQGNWVDWLKVRISRIAAGAVVTASPWPRRSRLGRTGADGFDTRGGLLGMPKERSSQEVHNLGRHGRGCRYVTSQNNWAIVFIGRNRR